MTLVKEVKQILSRTPGTGTETTAMGFHSWGEMRLGSTLNTACGSGNSWPESNLRGGGSVDGKLLKEKPGISGSG